MLNFSKTLLLGALLGLTACGPAGLPPAKAPSNWTSDQEVLSTIRAKTEVVERNPASAAAHRSLGLAFSANEVWGPASQCYQNTLVLDPGDKEAKFELAISLSREGNLDEALALLSELVAANPGHLPGRQMLAIELFDRDRLDEAQTHYQWFVDQDPNDFMGILGMGEVALAKGDAERAEELLLQAKKLAPRNLYIAFVLGQTYLDLDQEVKAQPLLELGAGQQRPYYTSVLAVEKAGYVVSRGARLNAAVALMNGGQFAQAIEQLEYLRTLDATDEVCLINLAAVYLLAGQHQDALSALGSVLAISPDNLEALTNQGICMLDLAKIKFREGEKVLANSLLNQAMDSANKALLESDRAGRTHTLKGQIQQLMGRNDAAVESFEKAVLHGDEREKTYLQLARLTGAGGNMVAVEKILRDSVAVSGLRLESQFQLCGVLLNTGRGVEARAIHERMHEMGPGHPKTIKLGELLSERGY